MRHGVALVVASVLALAVGVGTLTPASAPVRVLAAQPTSALPPPPATEKHAKLDSQLLAIASATGTKGLAEGLRLAGEEKVAVSGDSVRVVVTARGNRSAARDAIQAVGGRAEAEYADLLQAFVPLRSLGKLAEASAVSYVGQPNLPVADSVTDEGVAAASATAWQGAGLSGAGVKVGIIDLGFIGYPTAQASGDLPPSVTTEDLGCGGVETATDHGTAVAEVVHKMAPGAQLYLICIATDVNLGQAKDYAIAQGIKIVNHSVGWFNSGRGDGTGGAGTPDAIVADARANGILWVNAAGNEAQQHWSGAFIDTDANLWHEFAPGDELNAVGIAAGAGVCVTLKWDSWPATAQDFDLYLFALADLTAPVTGSTNAQTGAQTPTEGFCYTNTTGVSQSFGIAIRKFAATATPRFDLFILGTPTFHYVTAAGSIVEPASSPNAMAAGAICWQNDALEPYSGQGPTIDGRVKPDVAGQDATSSAVYGAAAACAGGFQGTSAAAPHVAGAAALVAEAHPTFTPAQIQSFLESRSVDLGTPAKDNQYGSGKLWLSTAPAGTSGATFVPLDPFRLLDSRFGTGLSGKFSAGVARTFQVTGLGGVPANAVAVTGNLTVTNQTKAGYVFLGPDPIASPSSSTLNFPLADSRANGVTVALGAGGSLSATYVAAGASTDLIFDVTGYFVGE